MRATKSGKYQLAHVGMAWMNWQLIALTHHLGDFAHITKIKLWVYPLAIHIHRHDHDVHVACALAIAKKRAFNTVSPCHQT